MEGDRVEMNFQDNYVECFCEYLKKSPGDSNDQSAVFMEAERPEI